MPFEVRLHILLLFPVLGKLEILIALILLIICVGSLKDIFVNDHWFPFLILSTVILFSYCCRGGASIKLLSFATLGIQFDSQMFRVELLLISHPVPMLQ